MYKYLLFTQSAVEKLINEPGIQSIEFSMGEDFINLLRRRKASFGNGFGIKVINDSYGLLFFGEKPSKTFLMFDLEQCDILGSTTDESLLIVLQKTFRFAVRFWNKQAFTSCEKIFKTRAVIFPFPFSTNSSFRIVLGRNLQDKRLDKRKISNCLLAYKYGEEGVAADVEEHPTLDNFRKGGESFLEHYSEVINYFSQKEPENSITGGSLQVVNTEHFSQQNEFKYLEYKQQLERLTKSQKNIVCSEEMTSPIRVEGPAGTGKTIALLLRTIRILQKYEDLEKEIHICFFTHSRSTAESVMIFLNRHINQAWLSPQNKQYLEVMTLQDYCIKIIGINEAQIIDIDAMEAKQYQLLLIQESWDKLKKRVFTTYEPLLSQRICSFLRDESENKILLMLQFEFSVRIKGIAEGNLDSYKKLDPITNGLPLVNDNDKEFIFRIFKEYQNALESQSVYDTDDIVLEALARLNAPLWRRERTKNGIDYIFADEVHLFNLNEQQVFHCLTKDPSLKTIPICFALDYAQFIGNRGSQYTEYLESNIAKNMCLNQELKTIFRSSQKIAELCASITASGALLFGNFTHPYKICESYFTKDVEDKCVTPELIMCENEHEMNLQITKEVKNMINTYKCDMNDIAVIFFDEELVGKYKSKIGEYSVNYINGRQYAVKNKGVIVSTPDYINGLEFKAVIMVGVDEGRVPQTGIQDISASFLRYISLNRLYIACSRAQYDIRILGVKTRGISSCLKHSIEEKTLVVTGLNT